MGFQLPFPQLEHFLIPSTDMSRLCLANVLLQYHIPRDPMEAKYLAQKVIIHPNHHLTFGDWVPRVYG